MRKATSKPVAVLISDVHYNPSTLKLADAAMRQAIEKANELSVPLIVAGDLHDTKALLRGECVKAMIDTFKTTNLPIYVIVGNHDKINERSEEHSLEFLRPYVKLVDKPEPLLLAPGMSALLLPYYSDAEELAKEIEHTAMEGEVLIMHQGVRGANMGHYVQDKTSLPQDTFANYRVISGHYHARQDIKCGRPRKGAVGLFSYIGNPYTLTFGEANDPEKGFQVLMSDGLLEFVPTNLRKHVVVDAEMWEDSIVYKENSHFDPFVGAKEGDLLWLKITGSRSELAKLSKKSIGERLLGHTNFKLDLIATDPGAQEIQTVDLKDTEVLSQIIARLSEPEEYKQYLEGLWKEIL